MGGVSGFDAVELFEVFLHVVVGLFGYVVEYPTALVVGVHGDEPVIFFLPGAVDNNEVEGFAVFFSDFEDCLLDGFVPELGFDAPMNEDGGRHEAVVFVHEADGVFHFALATEGF